MKVFGAMVVRNELDIIESSVTHFLPLVDKLLITSHNSEDGTFEVLERLAKQEPKIQLSKESGGAFNQDDFITQMVLQSKKEGAAWVLPIDGDELLIGDIRSALDQMETMKDYDVFQLDRINFMITVRDSVEELNPINRMRYTDNVVVLPKSMVRTDRFERMGFGNHSAMFSSDGKFFSSPKIWVAHYPYRSFAQYVSKIIIGTQAYHQSHMHLSDPKGSMSGHWKNMYQKFKTYGLAGLEKVWKEDIFIDEDKINSMIFVPDHPRNLR